MTQAEAPGEIVRRRVVVHGRVAGVGFRAAVRRQAADHGVAGWVADRPDGTIEAAFEGDVEAVERLVEFCREGPTAAQVERVDVFEESPEGLTTFELVSEPPVESERRGSALVSLASGVVDGRLVLVSGSSGGVVRLWDASTREEVAVLGRHDGVVRDAEIAELDGRAVAVTAGGGDRTVRVWDLGARSELARMSSHEGQVHALACIPADEGLLVVSAGADELVRLWSPTSGREVPLGRTDSIIRGIAAVYRRGGWAVAVGGDGGILSLLDVAEERPLQAATSESAPILSVTSRRRGDLAIVVTGDQGGMVKAWDADLTPLRELRHGEKWVRAAIPVDASGRLIVVAGDDAGTLRSWDLETGDELAAMEAGSEVWSLAVLESEGGAIVVSGHGDGSLHAWDPLIGEELEPGEVEERLRDRVEWISDAAAREDLLRRKPLAAAVASRLRRIREEERESSFLIHVDGPWGSGKSTLLNFLAEELGDDWLVVRYDAWRQARVGPPWWALLVHLRHAVTDERGRWERMKLRAAEAWSRMRRVGALYGLALVFAASLGLFFLLRPAELDTTGVGDLVRTVTAALAAIATLVGGALAVGRFLLWDSARGARVYEQIQTNPMESLATHFGWLIDRAGRPVVTMYLRTLLGRRRDEPERQELEAQVTRVRRRLDVSAGEDQILRTLRAAPPEVRELVAGSAVDRLTGEDVDRETEHELQKFAPLLEANPRSMKRFVNAYGVERAVRVVESNLVGRDPLALWTILHSRWPELAAYLRAAPEAIECVGNRRRAPSGAPEAIRALLKSPDVARVVQFEDGGPLTRELVEACAGLDRTAP